MIDFIFTVYIVLALISTFLYLPRLFGFFYAFKKFPKTKASAKRRIAVLIPARGESAIIGDLFKSIEKQDYDKSCFEAFVIVKESDDPTIEIAKKAGISSTVVPDQKCKGDAISGFFESLSKDKFETFDAFVIIDADGVLAENYLTELNAALEYDTDIVETHKTAKNFLGGKEVRSLFSNCAALNWALVDDLGNVYRTKKKMPLNLCGQGLLVRRRVIEQIGGWPYRTMTEDYELKLDSLARGFTSMYYPHAVIYTEEAISHRENFIRRTRWLTGYKQCDKKYKNAIKKKAREDGLSKGVIEYFFGLYPYFLFLVATILTGVIGLILAVHYRLNGYSDWLYAVMLLTVLPTMILYVLLHLFSWLGILAARKEFRSISFLERLAVALYNPIYLLEYVGVFLYILKQMHSKEAPVWRQTERVMKNDGQE